MARYSIFSLLRHGMARHEKWPAAWRSPEPKAHYDVVVIGGGGHGLATAYYLAKLHGISNVAVLEKGWIGGGNTGRNTTIVRSNYLLPDNAHFYEHSLKLWEGLSHDLNFNVMLSQRGIVNTVHSDRERDAALRRYNAMRLNGIDAEFLDNEQLKKLLPAINLSRDVRYPIQGAVMQRRGGVARHDAVAWGFARAADALGVDIIQNCAVTGIVREGGRVTAVETSRGRIGADRIGIAVAGHSGHVAEMAGLRLPIESHLLQAVVTEPVKPFFNTVVSAGAMHVYVSQTDKGEVLIGGDLDGYNSYSQRGTLPTLEQIIAGAIELYPQISRLRLMRQWAGVVDMSMDGSPIISKTPVDGLFLNAGWCYGGFKATPGSGWVFAHTIAHNRPHPLNEAFDFNRFSRGAVLDEKGAGPSPKAH